MEVVRGTAKTVVVTVMVRRGWRARWQGAAGAPAARVVKGGGREGGGEDGGGEVGGEGGGGGGSTVRRRVDGDKQKANLRAVMGQKQCKSAVRGCLRNPSPPYDRSV